MNVPFKVSKKWTLVITSSFNLWIHLLKCVLMLQIAYQVYDMLSTMTCSDMLSTRKDHTLNCHGDGKNRLKRC